MDHTFIFQEGTWTGKGSYFDQDNNVIPFEGTMRTTHHKDTWSHESRMKLSFEGKTIKIITTLHIIPPDDNTYTTTWTSEDPNLGNLSGMCIVIDDSILSTCASESHRFRGTEYFRKIDDTTYHIRGFLAERRTKLSSWAMELKKID